jgi:cell division inhibitor SepF
MKSRLGVGSGRGGYRDRAYDEYRDGSYDEQDIDDAYDDYGRAPGGFEVVPAPAPMRSFGVDRADYYNDNHAPLVTHSDVRSQPVALHPMEAQPRDRIPMPQARRRQPSFSPVAAGEDALAFKGGLARTSGSLSELQAERLRMEDTGRLTRVDDAAAQPVYGGGPVAGGGAYGGAAAGGVATGGVTGGGRTAGTSGGGGAAFGSVAESGGRLAQNQVRRRSHRRIERIHPVTYADAEQVARELRKGVVVVLDLKATRPELAKRILDFSFGVASALEGQVDRFADRVYVFTRNGPLTDEERLDIHA